MVPAALFRHRAGLLMATIATFRCSITEHQHIQRADIDQHLFNIGPGVFGHNSMKLMPRRGGRGAEQVQQRADECAGDRQEAGAEDHRRHRAGGERRRNGRQGDTAGVNQDAYHDTGERAKREAHPCLQADLDCCDAHLCAYGLLVDLIMRHFLDVRRHHLVIDSLRRLPGLRSRREMRNDLLGRRGLTARSMLLTLVRCAAVRAVVIMLCLGVPLLVGGIVVMIGMVHFFAFGHGQVPSVCAALGRSSPSISPCSRALIAVVLPTIEPWLKSWSRAAAGRGRTVSSR